MLLQLFERHVVLVIKTFVKKPKTAIELNQVRDRHVPSQLLSEGWSWIEIPSQPLLVSDQTVWRLDSWKFL